MEIRAFTEDVIDDAGQLLAQRHRAHRSIEPLLPARFEDPAAAAAEVEALWWSEGSSGAVAVRDCNVVGYLLGIRKDDGVWGPNVWVESAGHAVATAEDVRDLYAFAARRWVEEGRHRHYVLVPASNGALIDAWFRLSFGMQQVHAIRDLPEDTRLPHGVREARIEDLDDLVALAPLLADHQAQGPVFGPGGHDDEDELRDEVRGDIADESVGCLVAEHDGRVVANYLVVPIERSSTNTGLARPDGLPYLAWAATVPDARGSGFGVALTNGSFAWARARGHNAMVTDWRVTNLLASRFWPARGFRATFVRLYRSIP